MGLPDVLALELAEGLARCAGAGWDVELAYTKAPGDTSHGKQRILKAEEISPGKLILTVAGE